MIIFHGENQVASRQAFTADIAQAKQSAQQIVNLSGSDVTLGDLTTAVESVSLFGDRNHVYLEEFFSRRPSNEKKQILAYLVDCAADNSKLITIWDSKDCTSQLKSFPPSVVKNFSLPKYIFEFLDTLSLTSFRNCLITSPVEQIFASLVTRLHKVLLGQAQLKRLVDRQKLLTAYQQLLAIDYAQKTSASPLSLDQALEVWLLKL